mmetsp:Transcript_29125/g.84657  ORF Transcript_29125/g.84657 Transcript_29125/m.84657 type:complete len:546 (+) Transcript_29125:2199-3836(+)
MRFARLAVALVLLLGSNDATGEDGTATNAAAAAASASLIRTRKQQDANLEHPHDASAGLPVDGRLVTGRQEEASSRPHRLHANDGHRHSRPRPHLSDSARQEHVQSPRIQPRHRRYNNAKQTLIPLENNLGEARVRDEAPVQEILLRTITRNPGAEAESRERPRAMNMQEVTDEQEPNAASAVSDTSQVVTATKRQRRRLRQRNNKHPQQQQQHVHPHHRHAADASTGTSSAHDDSSSDDADISSPLSTPPIVVVPPHLTSQRILLVRGHGTHLCWTVDTGRYETGTLLVLDDCNVSNRHQYFIRENYSYDVESGGYSWLWRPVGWEFEVVESDDDDSGSGSTRSGEDEGDEQDGGANQTSVRGNNSRNNLYVVGHKYSVTTESEAKPSVDNQGGRWRMVLDELPGGVTDPLTQVFWTIGVPSQDETPAIGSRYVNSNSDVDLMGMGQHAYSTRLFVANEGDVSERDVPVVLRTDKNIHEAVERSRTLARTPPIRHGLDEFEEEVYQLNGHDREKEVVVKEAVNADAGAVAGVIPGKWSYVHVGG